MLRALRPIFLAVALLPGVAMAGTVEKQIVSQLKDQGFTQIEVNRTWLGRSRIVASSPNYTREIVVNPATGAIMRDYWEEVETDTSRNHLIDPSNISSSPPDDGKKGPGDDGGKGTGGKGTGGDDGGGSGDDGGDGGSGDGGSGGGGSGDD